MSHRLHKTDGRYRHGRETLVERERRARAAAHIAAAADVLSLLGERIKKLILMLAEIKHQLLQPILIFLKLDGYQLPIELELMMMSWKTAQLFTKRTRTQFQ
jgi:hypothetical protein